MGMAGMVVVGMLGILGEEEGGGEEEEEEAGEGRDGRIQDLRFGWLGLRVVGLVWGRVW